MNFLSLKSLLEEHIFCGEALLHGWLMGASEHSLLVLTDAV
jgi:hypothetical protein